MPLPFCLDLFVQNILFYIKEADLSIFLEFQELPQTEGDFFLGWLPLLMLRGTSKLLVLNMNEDC